MKDEEMKQYIIVFKELLNLVPMETIIAHCCHASVGATRYADLLWKDDRTAKWDKNHNEKVILVADLIQRSVIFERNAACRDPDTDHYTIAPFAETYLDNAVHVNVCWGIGPLSDEDARKIGLNDLPLFNHDLLYNKCIAE